MAVLPPKPEPIYNLVTFFQVGGGFTEDFFDMYLMLKPLTNWWRKIHFFFGAAQRIFREMVAYDKLSWEDNFLDTLESLKRKGWILQIDHCYILSKAGRKIGLEKLNQDNYNVLILMEFFIKIFSSHSREEALTKVIFLPYAKNIVQYLSHTHPLRAKLAYLIASIYATIGDMSNAITFQTIDIKITESLYKMPHQDLAISYRAMAVYHFYCADYGSAKYFIGKCVDNYQALSFSKENESYQSALNWQKDIQDAYETREDDFEEDF